MNRWTACSLLLLICSTLSAEPKQDVPVPAALNYEVKSIDGKPVQLADYQGQALLVVNVASDCGATDQYAGLQHLHEQFAEQGLVVCGFPCNQFGGQEPGSEAEIKAFCKREYSVTFPMFSKVEVNGEKAAPLFQHLTSQETKPKGKGPIGWNFEKFLINREGQVVGRFGTGVEPDDAAFVAAVQQALAK